ncbi:uncharacterized protein LOC144114085 isoform X3 [Amblyomma americanum]
MAFDRKQEVPDEDSSKSSDSRYVSELTESFSERAFRSALLTGLLLLVLLAVVHAIVFCSKENCFRALTTYSLSDYLAYSFTPSDEFWIAAFYGMGMFTATFLTVYLNSAIPGVEPPLPWDRWCHGALPLFLSTVIPLSLPTDLEDIWGSRCLVLLPS